MNPRCWWDPEEGDERDPDPLDDNPEPDPGVDGEWQSELDDPVETAALDEIERRLWRLEDELADEAAMARQTDYYGMTP